MAERPVFISGAREHGYVYVKNIKFEWFPGFSVKQKQKSIDSFHTNIKKVQPSLKVLEISSKSNIELGVALSAFNLKIKTKNDKEFSVETAFQASKVFEFGGPFIDLYDKSSKEAKKDPRLKISGRLLCFQYFGRKWDLEPKTFFYDWLYTNALSLNTDLSREVVNYDAFTDIEFNPDKSINCQAKSVALFVSLKKLGLLEEALSSIEKFRHIAYIEKQNDVEIKKEDGAHQQINFFDDFEL
ncbi:DUF6977 family protein [Paenibacillus sp. FSL H8-0283]|uniref:DarT1-associated NADAR antitoxin family protein n=1 Tax=Paenibacillus sp. FSL H8-0283 TaxID=2921383 RepID=UPI00325061FB